MWEWTQLWKHESFVQGARRRYRANFFRDEEQNGEVGLEPNGG